MWHASSGYRSVRASDTPLCADVHAGQHGWLLRQLKGAQPVPRSMSIVSDQAP